MGMKKTVPATGPLGACVLHIGEAPGRQEVANNPPMPFVGATGQYVRGAYRRAGLDVGKYATVDVRFNNVIPFNAGRLTDRRYADKLIAENWENVTYDLERTGAKVIVACGGVALRRLTGLKDIVDEHGGVIPSETLPEQVMIGGRYLPLNLPPGTLIVPMLHPAGVMQTKLQSERISMDRVLERVAGYAKGKEWGPCLPRVIHSSPRSLDEILSSSRVVTIDTEFSVETRIPFLIGLTTETLDNNVVSFKPSKEYCDVLRNHAGARKLLWVAHNYTADMEVLLRVGVDLRAADWFDTLLAHATLFSDLKVGLNHVALFWLDDVSNWKDMPHDNEYYNALDVHRTARVYPLLRDELVRERMMELFLNEVMVTAPLAYELEQRGLQVDRVMQAQLRDANKAERVKLALDCEVYVGDMFAAKDVRVRRKVDAIREELNKVPAVGVICPLHPAYDGVRGKKWASAEECCCEQVYAAVGKAVDRAPLRAFNAGNNHDLRWLLYDKEGFGLPVQKSREGKPTANADAIERLGVRINEARDKVKSKYHREDVEEIIGFLRNVKEYQHLGKLDNTFLTPPVDRDGVAHPEYRIWGTGTGRPASGADSDVAGDKGKSLYSFNALNVPEDCRAIFVPHRVGTGVASSKDEVNNG